MKNAAIYCRVSTEDQEREGTSLTSQREACIAKAKELDYEVPGDMVFSEAWTGTDTDRPKLNELRQMLRDGTLEVLICYSTDRLARNPIHIAIIAEECQKQDTDLVFVTEPLDTSPEGQLIQYVKGYAAQIEHEKIRERTMRGKRAGVLSGRISTGSPQLYGYHQEGGRRTIIKEEADIVRAIFNKITIEGFTPRQVVIELNNAGIPAPKGGIWSDGAIYRMIKNPAYMGITYSYRTKAIIPQRHKRKENRSRKETSKAIRNKSEWVEIPEVTPAIVSKETFTMIQEQIERNRHKTPHNKRHTYLFNNGSLRCGICGRSMIANAKKIRDGYTYTYRCISNTKPHYYGKCAQGSIRADVIEPLVWQRVSQTLTKPDVIKSEIEKRGGNKPVILEADQILVENNIASAKVEEQRYLRQYGKGVIDETELDAEIRRVRRYQEQQESKLIDIIEQLREYEEVKVSSEQLDKALDTITNNLQNPDHDLKQLALKALDITVILHSDGQVDINGTIPTEVQHTYATSSRAYNMRTQGINFTLPASVK